MTAITVASEKPALLGGPRMIAAPHDDLFSWPRITREDEEAVLEVLRRGAMSGTEVTQQFEKELADWHGVPYALATCNGTAALHSAMFACGVGVGDEVIAPSLTFWASITQALNLGASIHFAEVDPETLTLDPNDIEHRIGPRTKAIMVVHYCGYPADMDPIMDVAKRHGLKVIEDVSHAHGGRYKGRVLGTIGDAAGMSVMSGKSLAIGEGGVLLARERSIYERAVAFGHYERYKMTDSLLDGRPPITDPELRRYEGIPLGGYKYRMHQLSSAVGRVQLRHYAKRLDAIRAGMNRFWDVLEARRLPGIRAHRTSTAQRAAGTEMGGWYFPRGLYRAEELGGLPLAKFCEALRAEGVATSPGANPPLHLHPLFRDADVYGHGRPTVLAHAERDVRPSPGCLPVTESMPERCFGVPWFKEDRPDEIEYYVAAFEKVIRAAEAGMLG